MASWGDGGVDTVIDLRSHEAAPEGLGSAFADFRLEIQREECVKDIAGQEGDQQEALDGVGVVPVDMVGMPAVDQFVEPMVLDVPPLVTETDETATIRFLLPEVQNRSLHGAHGLHQMQTPAIRAGSAESTGVERGTALWSS